MSELDSEIIELKTIMLKQVEKKETLSKRSLDYKSPVLSATKKARTEDTRYPFEGISKEEFFKLSRVEQILSQVCNNFFNVNFLNY